MTPKRRIGEGLCCVGEVMSARRDEARHGAGAGEWWGESWSVDFAAIDGSIGGYVRFELYPNQRRAWCWVNIVRADGTVVVRDHDVPMPTGRALLARSEALWCELICETPMEHWSIGVEAFGVRLDDPLDAYRGEIGTRLAVGLELEWEAGTPAYDDSVARDIPDGSTGHYDHTGIVHGDILLADEVIAFDGYGSREHSWGLRDWWTRGWAKAAVVFDAHRSLHVDASQGEGEGEGVGVGHAWADGVLHTFDAVTVETTFDDAGLPSAATYRLAAGEWCAVAPILHAPVPLIAADGRTSKLARSLCRFTQSDGTAGHGWGEWLRVDPPA